MKHFGFTLVELMVVVAIIAILSSVAIPWYGQYVQRGNRGDGISSMQAILDAQERFYSDNVSYTTDLTRLGINDPYITPKGSYSIAARQCTQGGAALPLTQCVELIATGLNAQAQDGNLITNTIGLQQRVLGTDTFTW
jgi:type IV pilus assembly protein PilE